MQRWLLELHLYLGLFCLPYVVLFGISSLLLNHGIERTASSHWSAQIPPLAAGEPAAQAWAALRALELSADPLPQTLRRGAAGELSFRALRPGRSYQVSVAASGAATVAERDGGVLGVLRGLHGQGQWDGSLWALGWSVYTELTTAALVFSVVSGLALFLPRPSGRAVGVGAGVLGLAVSLALAASVW